MFMNLPVWNIEAITGYTPKTTFYEDFSIADVFGVEAVKDTYERAFGAWKDDAEYLTELVMVLNWKIWEHNAKNSDINIELTKLYDKLWRTADEYAVTHLTGDDLSYFFRTTD